MDGTSATWRQRILSSLKVNALAGTAQKTEATEKHSRKLYERVKPVIGRPTPLER
jgi:hypothetical protein